MARFGQTPTPGTAARRRIRKHLRKVGALRGALRKGGVLR